MAEKVAKRYEIIGSALSGYDYVPEPEGELLHPNSQTSDRFRRLFEAASDSIARSIREESHAPSNGHSQPSNKNFTNQ